MNDTTIVRSAAELERKYNLSKLAGLSSNVETNNNELIKIQNELTNMLNTLIINLGDVLDDNISLWFYPGIPNTLNEPYISWSDPTEHIGDIYYDQNSGNVYKYKNEGWIQNTDTNLISAMALTNAELDVSKDHERKVYLSQPIPPYDSGDWWILEDGSLKICQLGKESGEYDENDFVVSSKYTTTLATKQNDTITVLKGTVTEITEDYVKYTDLATGGSTTIAGENITTGSIKSNNYVPDTSGTSINLIDGKISTKNVKIDDDGLKLSNGAKVVGNNGLKNTYLYTGNKEYNWCGREYNYESGKQTALPYKIEFVVPKGLEITKAVIHVFHNPVYFKSFDYETQTTTYVWGKVHNMKLYKASNMNERFIYAIINSEYDASDSTSYNDVGVTWYKKDGTNIGTSFTAETPTMENHKMEEIYSSDFSNIFKNDGVTIPGLYQIKFETADIIPPRPETDFSYAEYTGWVNCVLEIEGYMTYS